MKKKEVRLTHFNPLLSMLTHSTVETSCTEDVQRRNALPGRGEWIMASRRRMDCENCDESGAIRWRMVVVEVKGKTNHDQIFGANLWQLMHHSRSLLLLVVSQKLTQSSRRVRSSWLVSFLTVAFGLAETRIETHTHHARCIDFAVLSGLFGVFGAIEASGQTGIKNGFGHLHLPARSAAVTHHYSKLHAAQKLLWQSTVSHCSQTVEVANLWQQQRWGLGSSTAPSKSDFSSGWAPHARIAPSPRLTMQLASRFLPQCTP
ncbi:hypothetical protein C8R45DRAFT_1112158 [Mycena sanguinolenta]|nr:hypothetical protein C8R45DRAFT_1112158 [Mycena sanguinolenta]